MYTTDRDTVGNSRSREVHSGAMEKASFMEDRVRPELGFGEVKKSKKDTRNT